MSFKDRPFFRRILEFDDLMRQGKRVNAASVAKKWETSQKTVQRFIETMRSEFDAPIVWDAQTATYRYEDPGYHLPWLPIEGGDLFAIGVAMKVLQMYEGTPAAADLKVIFDRISQLMPAEVRIRPSSLIEKLYVRPQAGRPVDGAIWEAVATALREKVGLRIDYRKPTGEKRVRVVQPYQLVLGAGDWFLLACDPEDDVVKTFYLTRIQRAEVTTDRFAPPKDFRPEDHFGDTIGMYAGKPPLRFRVRFAAYVAPWVEEVHWHAKQKLVRLPDGGVELELTAGSMLEARRFVLSFGKYAVALTPPELVADVREHVAELVKSYEENA